MKSPLLFLCFALAGCQSAAPLPPPPPIRPAPEPRPIPVAPVAVPTAPLEAKLRQQAQYIDALISQNETLAAKLTASAAPLPQPQAVAEFPPTARVAAAPASPDPVGELLSPNADGVIDLTAVGADTKAGEPVNPFAVRTSSAGPAKEITLRVSGILAGKTPCAVVNDRLVQANESIDALTVERIESDGVCLRFAGQRLRVPVSDQAVKVKLPL